MFIKILCDVKRNDVDKDSYGIEFFLSLQNCQICNLTNYTFFSDTIAPSEADYQQIQYYFNHKGLTPGKEKYAGAYSHFNYSNSSLKYIAIAGMHKSLSTTSPSQHLPKLFVRFHQEFIDTETLNDPHRHKLGASGSFLLLKENIEAVMGTLELMNGKFSIDRNFVEYLLSNVAELVDCISPSYFENTELNGIAYHQHLKEKAVKEIKAACSHYNPNNEKYNQCVKEREHEKIKMLHEWAQRAYDMRERTETGAIKMGHKGYKPSGIDADDPGFNKLKECVMEQSSDHEILVNICSPRDKDFLIVGGYSRTSTGDSVPGHDILTITCSNFDKALQFDSDGNVVGLAFEPNSTTIIPGQHVAEQLLA